MDMYVHSAHYTTTFASIDCLDLGWSPDLATLAWYDWFSWHLTLVIPWYSVVLPNSDYSVSG